MAEHKLCWLWLSTDSASLSVAERTLPSVAEHTFCILLGRSMSSSDSEEDVPLAHSKRRQHDKTAATVPESRTQESSKLTGEALAKAVLATPNRYKLLSLG